MHRLPNIGFGFLSFSIQIGLHLSKRVTQTSTSCNQYYKIQNMYFMHPSLCTTHQQIKSIGNYTYLEFEYAGILLRCAQNNHRTLSQNMKKISIICLWECHFSKEVWETLVTLLKSVGRCIGNSLVEAFKSWYQDREVWEQRSFPIGVKLMIQRSKN